MLLLQLGRPVAASVLHPAVLNSTGMQALHLPRSPDQTQSNLYLLYPVFSLSDLGRTFICNPARCIVLVFRCTRSHLIKVHSISTRMRTFVNRIIYSNNAIIAIIIVIVT